MTVQLAEVIKTWIDNTTNLICKSFHLNKILILQNLINFQQKLKAFLTNMYFPPLTEHQNLINFYFVWKPYEMQYKSWMA